MMARNLYHPELGQYFRALRESRGWSQRSRALLAARKRHLPIEATPLSWLETGRTKNPDPELLRALATLYGVPFAEVAREVIRHTYAIDPQELFENEAPTTVDGFVALPLLANPIAAGQPLAIAPDPNRDRTLSFREKVVRKFTRPICLRIGPREESMLPTLEPDDVLVIDQNPDRRRSPKAGHIYAVNFGPLTGDDGGAAKRIELSGSMLVVTSDNMNKRAYPTQVFNVTDVNLLDAIKGEVVWTGRYLGSGKKADVRNTKRKRVSA